MTDLLLYLAALALVVELIDARINRTRQSNLNRWRWPANNNGSK